MLTLPFLCCVSFFLLFIIVHRYLPSLPTRRSSDLDRHDPPRALEALNCGKPHAVTEDDVASTIDAFRFMAGGRFFRVRRWAESTHRGSFISLPAPLGSPAPPSSAKLLLPSSLPTASQSSVDRTSGRRASGRRASGRRASGRRASGRRASGRRASGRRASAERAGRGGAAVPPWLVG